MTARAARRYNRGVTDAEREDDDGLYAEDIEPGHVTVFGGHTVTADEIMAFGRSWDPQFIHIDEAAANAGPYRGLIASGFHSLAIFQRLSVLGLPAGWKGIAGAGIDGIRWRRPVRPGDTLTGSSEIVGVALEPDRRRGLVTMTGRLVNQDGKEALTLQVLAYVQMRGWEPGM